MEGLSCEPPDSNQAAPAASFLANLPSRGLFSSTVVSSNLDGIRDYLCVHDTSPPGEQLIKTNQQNILIRSLTLKKQKGDPTSKEAKGVAAADKKRAAERVLDSRAPAKRASNQSTSRQEGSNSRAPEKDLHSLTVERLRLLLKDKGLSPKGKKDELIARLKSVNDQA